MKLREARYFAIGFLIGSAVILAPFYFYNKQQTPAKRHFIRHEELFENNPDQPYNETLSDILFNKIKVLCIVMTQPENHHTKAIHVKNTWGKRCNKILFMSSKEDVQLGTVSLPLEESRAGLWNKTKASFQYAYDNYLDDYDWFMKIDDDNYIIMENIRYLLAHYNPSTALYFGHRYAVQQVHEGYMAGGGYILSKKALTKFAEKLVHNEKLCHAGGGAEDMEMGRCLAHSALFVDCRDELHQKRFFPVGVEEHMKKTVDPEYWYTKNQYYHVTQGNTSCCSETSTEYHYINPREMYLLDYFIYTVHPFGIEDHPNDHMPKKFSLEEVIKASDAKSPSPNFKSHKNNHDLEPSEIY